MMDVAKLAGEIAKLSKEVPSFKEAIPKDLGGKDVPSWGKSADAIPDLGKKEVFNLGEVKENNNLVPVNGSLERSDVAPNELQNGRSIFQDDNAYTYTLDANGRTIKVEGELRLEKGERNNSNQKNAGGVDRKLTDDGGHLIANRFNGSGAPSNLVAMDRNINRWGAYNELEEKWAKALAEGKDVRVKIDVIYDGESKRPDAFKVTYSIDGEKFSTTFKNISQE